MKSLKTLVNKRTENVGKNNFIFKYNGDEIELDKGYKTIGEVLLSDDDDDEDDDEERESGSFIIECFQITANLFRSREIFLKNATGMKLKVEVQYPGVDYNIEPQTRFEKKISYNYSSFCCLLL